MENLKTIFVHLLPVRSCLLIFCEANKENGAVTGLTESAREPLGSEAIIALMCHFCGCAWYALGRTEQELPGQTSWITLHAGTRHLARSKYAFSELRTVT